MEERLTRRDYIEILTCCAIILHLEDSRSHRKEAEAEEGQALGARPVDLGACNTPGVCHLLSTRFELKHDKFNGNIEVKVNL